MNAIKKGLFVVLLTIFIVFFLTIEKAGASEVIDAEELLFMEVPNVITASKVEEKIIDAPGIMTVVTKDELERFGGTTLKDILERVPSLISSTVYMTDRSVISVRGDQFKHSSSHVLMLLNGRPVREILEGGILSETLESFPINIIERIEVIRGPGSVLYGSGAFSGVINIITEKPEENKITLTGWRGESTAYDSTGEIKYRGEDLSIVAALRYHENSDWATTVDYLDAGSNVVSRNLDISDRGPGSYFEANYKNLRFMGSYNEWTNFYFLPEYMASFDALGEVWWKKGFGDFGYNLEVSDEWNMDFNLTYVRSTLETSSWPDVKRDSYEVIGEWTNFFNPTDKLQVVAGGLVEYSSGRELAKGADYITNTNRKSWALYVESSYWLRENMKLITGLQANKVQKLHLDIVPRLGFIWHLTSFLNFKTIYSEAFRAPSLNEVALDHPALKGSSNLQIEKVRTVDVGVDYYVNDIQCGATYFYSEQTDNIYQNRTSKFPVPTYDNSGKMTLQGIELEGKYNINKYFFLTGSTLYQRNEDEDGTENVSPIANIGAKLGLSYKSEEKGVIISLFNIYQGHLDDDRYATELNPSPGAYNKLNLNCRVNLHKAFNYNALGKDSFLLFKIDNLLDEEIWLPAWGLNLGTSIPATKGRYIYFGVEASF